MGWMMVVLVLVTFDGLTNSGVNGSCFNACSYSLICASATYMA